MKTYQSENAQITVTKLCDFLIWGTWFGNQDEVIRLVESLPGIHPLKLGMQLFCNQGKAAGDNTFEGSFCIQSA
jgi:hypothetical protein